MTESSGVHTCVRIPFRLVRSEGTKHEPQRKILCASLFIQWNKREQSILDYGPCVLHLVTIAHILALSAETDIDGLRTAINAVVDTNHQGIPVVVTTFSSMTRGGRSAKKSNLRENSKVGHTTSYQQSRLIDIHRNVSGKSCTHT